MLRIRPTFCSPVVLLLACQGAGDDSGQPQGEPCTQCVLTDESNYSFSSSMSIASVALQSGSDATLDWSALTTDIQGHAVQPSDVDKLTLLVMKEATQADVIEGLSTDSLQQSDITLYMLCEPAEIGTESSCNLSDFGILSSMLEVENYFIEGTGTWMIALQNENVQGALSMIFLEPSDDATGHTASFDDSTASLDVSVDLQSLTPLRAAAGPDITVDWSGLSTDGLGNSLSIHTLDTLYLARYTQDVESLEGIPFDLWTEAETLWEASIVGQTQYLLADLEGDAVFEGIESGWTWLLALGCSTCTNPTPRYVTLIEAE